ncbi:hypothetical protein [Methylobacterium sp. ID0610]|uniref:hypothetical protein n=1 Tax=Methylobacterium carpenticola TaxID=3344827 RepID=UPI0036BADE4E
MLAASTPCQGYAPTRGRRSRAARQDAQRQALPLPEIIVVEAGGYDTAVSRPDAVVLDRTYRCLRCGRHRLDLRWRGTFDLLAFVLTTHVGLAVSRADAMAAARPGERMSDPLQAQLLRRANTVLAPLHLRIETIWGGSLRLVAIPGDA